jgi:hypothetical protein
VGAYVIDVAREPRVAVGREAGVAQISAIGPRATCTATFYRR